jgi:tyramine---L-glutamate ligase
VKVIIYEYVSGGGYAQQPIPPSVLAEGYAMLRCVVSDFKAAGHELTVLLDDRLAKLNLPIDADCIVPVFYRHEPKSFIKSIASINDALYIIAPETDVALQSLVEVAEATGKVSLNCQSRAIAKVADKSSLYEILEKMRLAPKTITSNLSDNAEKTKFIIKSEIGYPAVLKPTDGVSCSGLSIVKDERQVERAIAKIKAESQSQHFIAQEFIKGESASVSLICNGKKAMALSLNKQNIKLATPDATSRYEGGAVPFDHPLKQKAFAAAEQVAEAFEGLRGYVGVDVVLTGESVFVVDVNARLTTSYVGLREIAGFNVAGALVDAVVEGKLPNQLRNKGVTCFSKVETPKPTIEGFQKTAELAEVISPPFPLTDNSKACALVASHGVTLQDANNGLEKTKAHLLNIVGRGKQFG